MMVIKTLIRDQGAAVMYVLPDGTAGVKRGEIAILQGENGLTYGTTSGIPHHPTANLSCCQKPRGTILRLASDQDLAQVDDLKHRESTAKQFCQQRADSLGLTMRVTEMEGNLSDHNLICHFSAERRVDFRELVREMGRQFHCHVQMHQIPPREQAQRLCGMGPCGRPQCCSSFMSKPRGVSSQQAREAAPGVPHAKLTGACGKLKCCLAFDGADNALVDLA